MHVPLSKPSSTHGTITYQSQQLRNAGIKLKKDVDSTCRKNLLKDLDSTTANQASNDNEPPIKITL